MKKLFNCRVYKVSIDGSFTCPNRDGSKGKGGCIYCDEVGASSRTNSPLISIRDQVLNNIKVRKSRFKAKKFIAYFQSYTNTYAPLDILKKSYDEAVFTHPDIIGLTISTRADCVDEKKLKLISSYKKILPYVSVEYGMQTIHNKTLSLLNRCESHQDFLHALKLTQALNLNHCVHIILGLPGETKKEQLMTADKIARLKIPEVKIHILVAMENTPLAQMYYHNKWQPLSFEEGTNLCCDFLERLPPTCVIHRIGGNGHPLHLIAPLWIIEKRDQMIATINKKLKQRQTCQGSLCKHL